MLLPLVIPKEWWETLEFLPAKICIFSDFCKFVLFFFSFWNFLMAKKYLDLGKCNFVRFGMFVNLYFCNFLKKKGKEWPLKMQLCTGWQGTRPHATPLPSGALGPFCCPTTSLACKSIVKVKDGKITQNESGKNYSNVKIQVPCVGDRETRSKNSGGSI